MRVDIDLVTLLVMQGIILLAVFTIGSEYLGLFI